MESGYTPPVKKLHLLAIGAFSVLLAACTVSSQDILEDVTEGSSSASSEAVATEAGERLLPEGILEIGNANARVTLRLFMNHDSPYSRAFHAHMPLLQTDFIAKGDLKVQIVPVAFKKYPESDAHARRLICAAAQGKGLAMHGLLMTGGETLVPLGINRPSFDACLQDALTTASVASLAAIAANENVTVVPTYTIDGDRFTGVPTAADLLGAMRSAL